MKNSPISKPSVQSPDIFLLYQVESFIVKNFGNCLSLNLVPQSGRVNFTYRLRFNGKPLTATGVVTVSQRIVKGESYTLLECPNCKPARVYNDSWQGECQTEPDRWGQLLSISEQTWKM